MIKQQLKFDSGIILELGSDEKIIQVGLTLFESGELSWNESLYFMIVNLVQEKKRILNYALELVESRTSI